MVVLIQNGRLPVGFGPCDRFSPWFHETFRFALTRYTRVLNYVNLGKSMAFTIVADILGALEKLDNTHQILYWISVGGWTRTNDGEFGAVILKYVQVGAKYMSTA